MRRMILAACVILTAILVAVPVSYADITATGDVSPADPANWTTSMYTYIGDTGVGGLSITGGSEVLSSRCRIGYQSGSTGVVTVDGAGSAFSTGYLWANCEYIFVGSSGDGTLNITDGGSVLSGHGRIGDSSGSTGVVTVDGIGSTWTSQGSIYAGDNGTSTLNITNGGLVTVEATTWLNRYSGSSTVNFNNGTLTTVGLYCDNNDLTGTGTINAKGVVCDVDLVFDSTHGLTQTIHFDGTGQDVTLNLDVDGSAEIGAGCRGVGTMSISDGVVVASSGGRIGYKGGSTGTVTVSGAGSTWAAAGSITVGYGGSGTLNITGGGTAISNGGARLADYLTSSTGVATVDGDGSSWTWESSTYIGRSGIGTLNITGGGEVVNNGGCTIAYNTSSTGVVTVNGIGSTLTNATTNTGAGLYIGHGGSGTLNITGGGMVSVRARMTIDVHECGNGFVNMSTGGMLALYSYDDASNSLGDFLNVLYNGTEAIRYWDGSGWADINGATLGTDYTLEFITSGDLGGYTMLTVGVVPEPATMSLLGLGFGFTALLRRRRK